MYRNRLITAAGIATVLTAAGLFLFCDLGDQPLGPTIQQIENQKEPPVTSDTTIAIDSITRNMRIFASPTTVRASNTDKSTVTVIVYNDSHNPVGGKEIRFSTTHGFISARDTTDSNGVATATFTSVPINTEAAITATMTVNDSQQVVGTHIKMEGLSVKIIPTTYNTVLNTTIPLKIIVLDGAGQPVPHTEVVLRGLSATQATTAADGTFMSSISSTTQRSITIAASALGASDSITVNFWSRIPDGQMDTVASIRKMRIFSSRTQLRADNTDFATITVILTNENNNPATGGQILFSADIGIIDSAATVDASGRAVATLRSVPVNGTCRVTAVSKTANDTVSTQVLFSGVAVQLVPQSTDLKVGENALIEIYLKDGSGIPIGGEVVTLASTGGTFANGSAALQATLNPNGFAAVTLTSSMADTVFVFASVLNTNDSTSIVFSNNRLTATTSRAVINTGGNDSSQVIVTYVNGAGSPLANQLIVFATNAGTVSRDSVLTNTAGQASTWLRSAPFAGTARVQATSATGNTTVEVKFVSLVASDVSLAITPDNIRTNGGIATLVATVRDANGNMVSNANVNFRILKGPGGGEYITKPVVTSQDGVARSTLIGGSQPSSYRGCEVVAAVGTTADTSKLTISGEPFIISVSRPEDDTVTVPDAGFLDSSTFDFFIGAVVQDINGNPVADGTEVHFSAVVSGMQVAALSFVKWKITVDGPEPIMEYRHLDIPFEDINNNFRMDPTIDLKIDDNNTVATRGDDVNGDGVCDFILDTIFEYNAALGTYDTVLPNDFYYDFNGNGRCDPGVAEPSIMWGGNLFFADLNRNGYYDASELINDFNGNGVFDPLPSRDFRWALWEMRPFLSRNFRFQTNDIAVTIATSAVTRNGVARTVITYPRQFARRLIVTVNAEANGIYDRDGERFVLPIIR